MPVQSVFFSVLIRILQIYYNNQLEQVGIDTLLKYHLLIDRYETFVLDTESKRKKVWPEEQDSLMDAAIFRGTVIFSQKSQCGQT